jgi:hypothetical protein
VLTDDRRIEVYGLVKNGLVKNGVDGPNAEQQQSVFWQEAQILKSALTSVFLTSTITIVKSL